MAINIKFIAHTKFDTVTKDAYCMVFLCEAIFNLNSQSRAHKWNTSKLKTPKVTSALHCPPRCSLFHCNSIEIFMLASEFTNSHYMQFEATRVVLRCRHSSADQTEPNKSRVMDTFQGHCN